MASDSSPSEQFQTGGKKRPAGLLGNAMKRKDGFIQLFFMTGILLLSMRSLGQKHRINDLLEDTAALKEERDSLAQRMHHIKSRLLHEASLDSTGLYASRLGRLFNQTDT